MHTPTQMHAVARTHGCCCVCDGCARENECLECSCTNCKLGSRRATVYSFQRGLHLNPAQLFTNALCHCYAPAWHLTLTGEVLLAPSSNYHLNKGPGAHCPKLTQ